MAAGDILSLNTFPMIGGYYTALERTLFLGHVPSAEHLRVWEANVAVHERGAHPRPSRLYPLPPALSAAL
eukprot:4526911-Prymnesium_polylepis.1